MTITKPLKQPAPKKMTKAQSEAQAKKNSAAIQGKDKPEPKTPVKLGTLVDQLYLLRASRIDLERKAEELKAKETTIKKFLIDEYKKVDLQGARGKVASCSIKTKDYPSVAKEDWGKVQAFIRKNNAFELLQHRLNDKAVKEYWERGKTIPGVNKFTDIAFSLTKI